MRALGGRYRLEKKLGAGGMAAVWRAHDLVLGRSVAVKLLTPDLADRTSRDRIRAEAKVAAKLAHPNVASVYDFGESWRGPRTRVPYIVMELVEGPTLAARLRGGRPHWRTAVCIAAEVAAALAAAHASGVVHRDVKPANIMLAPTGVKVVDFGIAAAAGALEDKQGGLLLGTPAYVAPERLSGEAAVPATDVYALGVVLYQCLTGVFPWPASTATEFITAHREWAPDPLPPVDGLPDDVVELVDQCLHKVPGERPSSLYAALVLAEAAGVALTLPSVREADGDSPREGIWDAPTDDRAARDDRPDGGTVAVAAGPVDDAPDDATAADIPAGAAGARPAGAGGRGGRRAAGATVRPSPARRRALAGAAVLASLVAGISATAAQFRSADSDLVVPGSAASPRPTGGCEATYVGEYVPGGMFTADLVLVNTGTDPMARWQVGFAVPDGQVITGAGGARVDQDGKSVTLTGEQPLGAGARLRLSMSGTYALPPAAPSGFSLAGVPCAHTTADLRGAAAGAPAPTGDPAGPGDTGSGNNGNSGSGNSGSGNSGNGNSGNGNGGSNGSGGNGSGGSGPGGSGKAPAAPGAQTPPPAEAPAQPTPSPDRKGPLPDLPLPDLPLIPFL